MSYYVQQGAVASLCVLSDASWGRLWKKMDLKKNALIETKSQGVAKGCDLFLRWLTAFNSVFITRPLQGDHAPGPEVCHPGGGVKGGPGHPQEHHHHIAGHAGT